MDDGVTLENKLKYQSFGLQFTDRAFKCNHVVAIAFRRCKDNTGEGVGSLAKTVVKEVTWFQTNTIVGSAVHDGAAKSVARSLGLEVETCDMHDTDKVGQSAIGELTRSKDHIVVNPFPEGLELLQKLRDQAKWFESSSKHRNDYADMLTANPHLPTTKIQRDLNGTRMSAVYNLIQSSLSSKRALLTYKALYPNIPRF